MITVYENLFSHLMVMILGGILEKKMHTTHASFFYLDVDTHHKDIIINLLKICNSYIISQEHAPLYHLQIMKLLSLLSILPITAAFAPSQVVNVKTTSLHSVLPNNFAR